MSNKYFDNLGLGGILYPKTVKPRVKPANPKEMILNLVRTLSYISVTDSMRATESHYNEVADHMRAIAREEPDIELISVVRLGTNSVEGLKLRR